MSSSPGDNFYVTGGAMRPEAVSYITRRADDELFDALTRGELCSVLTPSQTGKSSLMTRTAARLVASGVAVARIDLTGIGENLEIEQWYLSLLLKVGRDLGLRDELRTFWQENKALGPLLRWMEAIREVVLPRQPGRVVIFIDEIGVVTKLPFSTDDFFAAIRACYHSRPDDPELERLTFCLLGVATPWELLRDPHTTAFNVGRRIELEDFTPGEAEQLTRGLGRPQRLASKLLRRIFHWTRGHPYLTQRLCSAVAADPAIRSNSGVDRVCRRLFLDQESRSQDTNLKEVERQILKRGNDVAEVIGAYRRTRRALFAFVCDDERNPAVAILRISGIARVSKGCLQVRNRIYASVFDREWMRSHLPDAEVRRQRAAFLKGFGLAALVTSILVSTTGYAFSVRRENEKLRALRELAEKNAAEARLNEKKAHYESTRLKDGVARIYDWQKHVVKNLPIELRKDPFLKYVPRPMFQRFIAIAMRTSIANYEGIVDDFPDLTGLRQGMASLYHNQGQAQREIPEKEEALRNLRLAVDHQLLALRQEPGVPQYRRDLSAYYGDLALALASAGRHDEAIAFNLDRARLWPDDPRETYEVVRCLAACVPRDDPDSPRKYGEQAMALLKQGLAKGYPDLATLKGDRALDPLSGHDGFRAFLGELDSRAQPDPPPLKVAQ